MNFIRIIPCLFVLILSYPSHNYGQYVNGHLVTANGDTIKGLVRPFYSYDPAIFFKANENSRRQKFRSEKLIEISISLNGQDQVFHNYYLSRYKNSGTKVKKLPRHCWATKIYESPEIEAFLFPEHSGKHLAIAGIINVVSGSVLNPYIGIEFYEMTMSVALWFPNDEAIIDIFSPQNGKKNLTSNKFKKRLKYCLINRCLAFRKELKQRKDYKITDLVSLLDFYSDTCSEH